MADSIKVRASQVNPGHKIKAGALWFTVSATENRGIHGYPAFMVHITAQNERGPILIAVHKYTLVTITES